MIHLFQPCQEYLKPQEVAELYRSYLHFYESLHPAQQYKIPDSIRRLFEKYQVLKGTFQTPPLPAVELERLENKAINLEQKYGLNIFEGAVVLGLGMMMSGIFSENHSFHDIYNYVVRPVQYLTIGTGLIHTCRSASLLMEVKDVRCSLDALLKNILFVKKGSVRS